MEKNKKAQIYFQVNVNGNVETVVVSPEELRQCLKEAKIKRDTTEKITLRFNIDKEPIDISMKMSDVNMLLKQAMLTNSHIIPNSLKKYLEDLTQKLSKKPIEPIAKREHEIEKVWFYISQKTRNNAFLTGNIDVGKTAIAHEIARQISTNECPKEFYEKHVISLKPERILEIKSDYIYERTVQKLINFLVENRKKIVLYIDNAIYMKVDEYLIKMLYSCIINYHIPMIGTLNVEDYESYFLGDINIAKYLNEVYVKEPEMDELRLMIDSHLKLLEKRYEVKISEKIIKFGIYTAILSESPSSEPGNVISIFKKAFREARRKGKKEVDKQCILSCYNTYLQDYEDTPEEMKRGTAYHEAGHYIARVMSKYQKNLKISCVSILPMLDWAGVTCSYYEKKEYYIASKEYFVDEIAMDLAGRVAEKKYTNVDSAGACSDLEHASMYAKAIVMKWGFSDKENNKNRSYDYEDYFLMPESKKELIDKEIQELIDAGMQRAEKVINENEGLLKVIAERLMVEEILTGEELENICKEYEESNK